MIRWLVLLVLVGCASVPQPKYNNIEILTGTAQVQDVHFFCEDQQSAQAFALADENGRRFLFGGTRCRFNEDKTVPIRLDRSVYTYVDTQGLTVDVWLGNLLHEGTPLEPQVYIFLATVPGREA